MPNQLSDEEAYLQSTLTNGMTGIGQAHLSKLKRKPEVRARSIAAIKRHRTARLASLATKAYYLHRQKRTEDVARLICEEFVKLGGVYIKFLQGVLLRSDQMKKWQNPERLKIFENLDTEPIDIMQVLQHELKPHQLKQILSIQPQPFAAGSFGQVYYGQHANGKAIIVKVLRPMVRETLRYDLRLLKRFSKTFVNRLYRNMDIKIDTAIDEFCNATLRETDYVEEAHFAAELYEIYKNHPKFIIPETFLDLCTTNIIVQEYVPGISAAQLMKLQEQGVDPKAYIEETLGSDIDIQLEILGVESITGVFTLERIQGDPHPGNVRFLTDNRVGLIDFGISAHTPTNKAAFFGLVEQWNKLYSGNQTVANLFEQFIRFFVSDLYRALRKLATLQQSSSAGADFNHEIGKVAQETFSKVLGTDDITPLIENGSIVAIINNVVNKENRFGLVVKLEATEILRAAQTYLGLVETFGRRNEVLPRVFREVTVRVEAAYPAIRHQQDDSLSFGEALDIVSTWLERVAERDPALFSQLISRIKLSSK